MITKTKYEWQNKLSFNDRLWIVRYYLEGYGLFHIASVYGVTTSTVEYHLKKASVFIPNKKPTLFGNVNPIQKRRVIIQRTLTQVYPMDDPTHYYDEYGYKYLRPKSYKQLLNDARKIERLRRATYVKPQEQESTGFLIKVDLHTGACTTRDTNGQYITFAETPRYSTSSSTISW